MRRICELIARTKVVYPDDFFFANFEQSLETISLRRDYQAYECALSCLDPKSWTILQNKAIAHFKDHRLGQRKQGFFNQLNDAFAYQCLVRKNYKQVRILCEVGQTQPDIVYLDGRDKHFCEVKTIGISDEALKRRSTLQVTSASIYQELSAGFLSKLKNTLDTAEYQIKARSNSGLIFLLVHFDDFTLTYYDQYRKQIVTCLEAHPAENIYVKIGLTGRKYIRKPRSKF